MNEKKTCKKCYCTKLLTEFNKGKKYKDGHRSYCKVCQRQYFKTYDQAKKKGSSFEKFLDKIAGITC